MAFWVGLGSAEGLLFLWAAGLGSEPLAPQPSAAGRGQQELWALHGFQVASLRSTWGPCPQPGGRKNLKVAL